MHISLGYVGRVSELPAEIPNPFIQTIATNSTEIVSTEE